MGVCLVAWSRFSECSVYTFPNTDGQLECCACHLMEGPFDSFTTTSVEVFLTHLEHHRQRNYVVPDWLFDLVRKEAPDYVGGAA
jgi:hypothetical protein